MSMPSCNDLKNLSPWSEPKNPEILFPLESYESLLNSFGKFESSEWLKYWLKKGGASLAFESWPIGIKSDWIWGLGLPFLSEIENSLSKANDRVLLGISGLPGCGKTSLGIWLEAACLELNWPLTVVSLDDFYLPAIELDKAMEGNPWGVPRGLPGSHSIELIKEAIDNWMSTGDLITPQFDKALRNGRGDRSGWRNSRPRALIIEGWFLGCYPITDSSIELPESNINPPISHKEKLYRAKVQSSLSQYSSIWARCKRIWHLKSLDFSSVRDWKIEQELKMNKLRGASLQGESLNSFIRMIQASIPHSSLINLDSNVIAKINSKRQIEWIGLNCNQ